MRKLFFRLIIVPALIVMGFAFQPALTVYAKEDLKKTRTVTDFDNPPKIYQEEENPRDYTYEYSFIGWSLNPDATYKDKENEDITKKVFTEVDDLSMSGSELFKACEGSGNVIYENGRTGIKLFAIWDEHPILWAYDVSFTGEQVRAFNEDSFLKELLKPADDSAKEGVYVMDYEDGSDVELTVLNYDFNRFLSVGDWNIPGGKDEEEFEITIQATDGAGCVSTYPIVCHITSEKTIRTKTASKESPIYYRFVSKKNWMKNPFWNKALENGENRNLSNEEYERLCKEYAIWILDEKNYKEALAAYENGGMEPYSKWYLDPKLVKMIQKGFEEEE